MKPCGLVCHIAAGGVSRGPSAHRCLESPRPPASQGVAGSAVDATGVLGTATAATWIAKFLPADGSGVTVTSPSRSRIVYPAYLGQGASGSKGYNASLRGMGP